LRDKPLVSFFVLAYGVTWLLWSPLLVAAVLGTPDALGALTPEAPSGR
jgi:hypothetical protein